MLPLTCAFLVHSRRRDFPGLAITESRTTGPIASIRPYRGRILMSDYCTEFSNSHRESFTNLVMSFRDQNSAVPNCVFPPRYNKNNDQENNENLYQHKTLTVTGSKKAKTMLHTKKNEKNCSLFKSDVLFSFMLVTLLYRRCWSLLTWAESNVLTYRQFNTWPSTWH